MKRSIFQLLAAQFFSVLSKSYSCLDPLAPDTKTQARAKAVLR